MKNLSRKDAVTIVSASIAACFFSNFLFLTNILKNADCWQYSPTYRGGKWEISVGRWMIPVIDILKGRLNIPYVTALFSFVWIALAVLFFADIFRLTPKRALVTAALFSTAPWICVVLSYSYCCDSYTLAFFLSVFSAWCLTFRYRNKVPAFLAAAVSIMASCALYQAFLGCTLVILIFCTLTSCFEGTADIKQLFRQIGVYAAAVISGLFLYLASTKLIALLSGTQMQEIYSMPLWDRIRILPSRIRYAYISFQQYFFSDKVIRNRYLQSWLFSILAVCYVVWAVKKIAALKAYRNRSGLLFAVLLHILVPLAACVMVVASPSNNMAVRISAPIFMVIPCLFGMITEDGDKIPQQDKSRIPFKSAGIIRTVSISAALAISYVSFLAVNATYEQSRQLFNYTRTTAEIILHDIQKEEFDEMPVCIIGTLRKEDYYGILAVENMGQPERTISDFAYYEADTLAFSWNGAYSAGSNSWSTIFAVELGYPIPIVNDGTLITQLAESPAFERMPVYPDPGYIQMIDDVIVVKLNGDLEP